jgi:hypothetical protein
MNQPTASQQLASIAFRQAWQGIFVFMLPAALAMIIGYYLDDRWQSGKTWTVVSLGLALIVSWLIIWRRYVSFKKTVIKVRSTQTVNQPDSAQDPANY